MISRSRLEETIQRLRDERNRVIIKRHHYQAVGLGKAIDELIHLLHLENNSDAKESS